MAWISTSSSRSRFDKRNLEIDIRKVELRRRNSKLGIQIRDFDTDISESSRERFKIDVELENTRDRRTRLMSALGPRTATVVNRLRSTMTMSTPAVGTLFRPITLCVGIRTIAILISNQIGTYFMHLPLRTECMYCNNIIGLCCHILNPFTYQSTSSTTSVRADSSILEPGSSLCGHKTTIRSRYTALLCGRQSRQHKSVSRHRTGYDRHTLYQSKNKNRKEQRTRNREKKKKRSKNENEP